MMHIILGLMPAALGLYSYRLALKNGSDVFMIIGAIHISAAFIVMALGF